MFTQETDTSKTTDTNTVRPVVKNVTVGTKVARTKEGDVSSDLIAKIDPKISEIPIIETENREPMRGGLQVINTPMRIKLEPDSFIRIETKIEGIIKFYTDKKVHPEIQFLLPSNSGTYVVEKSRETWSTTEDILILRDKNKEAIVSGVIITKLSDENPQIIGIKPNGEEINLKYQAPKIPDGILNSGPHDSRYVYQSSFQPTVGKDSRSYDTLIVPKTDKTK
jgi:hypothetical protein